MQLRALLQIKTRGCSVHQQLEIFYRLQLQFLGGTPYWHGQVFVFQIYSIFSKWQSKTGKKSIYHPVFNCLGS